ncbi:hypothetical protein [Serratia entomophila]|uniref:hypothetical protein n=1 Tax=Serratia entomophila TaxID=42906 RepID=UPI00217A7C33|nr:hypothetical protein [Serratia entomophila]CAI1745464.1 Uncharacterised protein [Serratia entomophila]
MFKQANKIVAKDSILEFEDSGGDDCSLASFNFGDLIEIKVRGCDDFIALDKESAIKFAKKILELTS